MTEFNDRRFKDPAKDITPVTSVGPFHKPGMSRNGQLMGRGISKLEKPKSGQPTGTFGGNTTPNTKSEQPKGTFGRGISKLEKHKSGQPMGTFGGNTTPGMKPKNDRLMGQLNK